MEEPYPRSQSVMQTRGSTFQNKASKILQKVSHFRTRIRLSSRNGSFKTEDDSHMDLNRSPYMRETRSMDIDRHTKPYMSQPMLTIPNMLDPVSHDTDDYSSSSSPHHSPTRRTFDRDNISASTANIITGHRSNPNTHKNSHPNSHSKQGMSRTTVNGDGPPNQSMPKGLMPVIGAGTGIALGHDGRDVGIDGLPVPADNLLFLRTPPSTQTAKQKDPVTSGPPRATSQAKRDLERRYQKQLDLTTDASAQVKKGPSVAELDKGTRIGSGVTELKSHSHSAVSSSSQLDSSSRSTDSTPSTNASSSSSHSTGTSSASSSLSATRPPLSSSSSSTSVQSLGQASVLSTATSNSDASFKSFANSDLDGLSGSGPVLGLQPDTGMSVSGMRLAAVGGQGASASTVTITQSGSDVKQAQGHGRGMKEKELPSRPDSLTANTLDAVEMGKVSTSTSVAPSSPSSTPPLPSKDAHTLAKKFSRGRNVADDKSSTRSRTNNVPSHSPLATSNVTSAATCTVESSRSATPPIPDRPSMPPLKRPSTSPAAPISPSQFTSFASIVEANSASPSPSITTTAAAADTSETTTPTQTTNRSLPIPASSLSTSFSSQHVRAFTTQAVPLSSPSSSSVSTPLSQSLPGRSQPNPTRRPTIPRLTTPIPGHRFSLQMTDGEAIARLSPSIIIRQPLLPLNLPKLGERVGGETDANGIGGDDAGTGSGTTRRPMTSPGHVGRSSSMGGSGSGVRLKHMPALPMAGTSREATGREEEDTDSGESEDDEDDDDEDNDHNEHAEEDDGDGDDDDTSRETSEQQQAVQAQAQKKANPFLPSLVERGSFSLFQSAKGKEKENQRTFTPSQEESMKTPTIGVTGAATPALGGPSGMKTPKHVPAGQQDYFSARFSSSFVTGGSPVPSPGRPSLYKQASRSMLDIPGFAVGTPSIPASLPLSKAVETPKDGVLDGVKGMTRKRSKEWLGRKKSRDLKDQGKQSDAKDQTQQQQEQQPQQRKSSENDGPKPVQAPLPSTTNRDDLILEEPRRLGGAAIAAAAANLTSTLQTAGEREASNVNNQGGVDHVQSQANHSPYTQDAGTVNPLTSLRRRRSMPSFTASSPPPPYPAFPLKCHSILELPPGSYELPPSTTPPQATLSRFAELQRQLQLGTLTGEEGNEKLPSYTNEIYLRAIMPRKMEFIRPGVQAKDRKWRRVICELEGTVFRVYNCPAEFSGTGKVTNWWERKVGVGDVSIGQGVGGGGSVGGTVTIGAGANAADEQRREEERERARREKLEGETQAGGQTHTSIRLPPTLRIQDSTQTSPAQTPPRHSPTSGDSSSLHRGRETSRIEQSQEDTGDDSPRSRSRFANLLKPGKTHHRSRSEVPPSPRSANPPRSSFNIPRPSFGASSSSDIGHTSASSSVTSMTPATSNQSLSLSVPTSTASTSLSSLAPPQSGSSLRGSSITRSRASSRASTAPPTLNYPPGVSCPAPNKNDLIKAYTLQNAESGLGNDYVKRKNVIRVRMEGEQFLVQARDVAEVVSWIEGLHAATNIALDLDERPMPRGPMFPRRRRRRARRTENTTGTGNDEAAGEGSNSNVISASVS